MKRGTLMGLAAAGVLVWLAAPLGAAALGTACTYQGKLRLEGLPVNEACDLQFGLWTAEQGGSQAGSILTVPDVLPSGGEFTAELDFGPGAFAGEARWLEVAVRCPAGSGNYTTLAPRQGLLATPQALYALSAAQATTALGAPWSGLGGVPAGFADGVDNDTQYTAGVGLQLSGTVFSIQAKGVATSMLADNAVTSDKIANHAVDWSEIAPYAVDSTRLADNAVHTNNIVNGQVFREDLAAEGAYAGTVLKAVDSVKGLEWGVDGIDCPYFDSGSFTQMISLTNTNISDLSEVIHVNSPHGYALYGVSGEGKAAVAGSNHSDGQGLYGVSELGDGVYGWSDANGHGVYGQEGSNDNYGYLGSKDYGALGGRGDDTAVGGLGSTHGVYGRITLGLAGRYAGYFNGPTHVNGTLTKTGGSFKIDHPLDPAGKYLSHSFVESPDMKNVYDGVAVLDDRGEAEVALPEWFEALNRDFRYQLTCVGGFAPVYIAEEISGNRFRIAGGTRGLKVCWLVTGIRKDAWAEVNRIPVEEDKPAEDRGRYLHPEVFGETDAKSIDREPARLARPEPRKKD